MPPVNGDTVKKNLSISLASGRYPKSQLVVDPVLDGCQRKARNLKYITVSIVS